MHDIVKKFERNVELTNELTDISRGGRASTVRSSTSPPAEIWGFISHLLHPCYLQKAEEQKKPFHQDERLKPFLFLNWKI